MRSRKTWIRLSIIQVFLNVLKILLFFFDLKSRFSDLIIQLFQNSKILNYRLIIEVFDFARILMSNNSENLDYQLKTLKLQSFQNILKIVDFDR